MNSAFWRVAAASVRGSSHEKTGAPCQDACQWALLSDKWLVAAVADGAGSAPYSEVGAAAAARAATEFVLSTCGLGNTSRWPDGADDQGWHRLLQEALKAAGSAVVREAEARSVAAAELATTLLLAVASIDFVAAVQLGDGAIVVADENNRYVPATSPLHGESLDATVFLTSDHAVEQAQPVIWRGPLAHLAVLSDGLQMAALRMPSGEPHPGFFRPLFEFLRGQADDTQARDTLAEFLVSPRLRERTDDDVTLLLATLVR